MSITYTPATNFTAKDSMSTSNPDKVLSGVPFDAEFSAIQTAFASAAPTASPTFSGNANFQAVFTEGDVVVGGDLLVDGRIVEDTVVNVSFSGSYTLGSGTAALIYHTLSGSATYTDSVVEGQNITLMLDSGANGVTWPAGIKWVGGSAPDLDEDNHNIISIWKVNGILFGSWGGSVDAS